MQVAFDGRFIQDHYPGIGRYAYSLVSALAETCPQDSFLIMVPPATQNTRYPLGDLGRFTNVRLIEVAVAPSAPASQWMVTRLIQRLNPDLVHIPHMQAPLGLNRPMVVTLHDLTPWLVPLSMPNALRRLGFIILAHMVVRRARQVITGSTHAAGDLRRHLHVPAGHITVVPHGVDGSFHPVAPEEAAMVCRRYGITQPYLLYTGSNKPHKNINRLVQAWALLPAGWRTSHRLVLAGAEEQRYSTSSKIAQQLQVSSSVMSLGSVPGGDLPALYSAASGFIFPSLYEGFGLPVLEAMACGAPVACSGTSALPEITGGAALLFDPYDEAQISAAMQRLLQDEDLRRELRRQGLEEAANYTWEHSAQMTMDVYRSICAQASR